MMMLPPKTQIWIAAGVTDMRRGFDGLSALVQTKLEQTPFSGHVFVFRGRRGEAKRRSACRFLCAEADTGRPRRACSAHPQGLSSRRRDR
jgi:transposase